MKRFGTPLVFKVENEVILPESERWEISDETKEKIRKIEENIRYANFMAPFIRVG
jgi:hypothetical protein